jgi:nucleoside permease NupC
LNYFQLNTGGVLAAFISFGISASHLLSASVMSAPAALAYSKLFYPESEKSQTKADDVEIPKG